MVHYAKHEIYIHYKFCYKRSKKKYLDISLQKYRTNLNAEKYQKFTKKLWKMHIIKHT